MCKTEKRKHNQKAIFQAEEKNKHNQETEERKKEEIIITEIQNTTEGTNNTKTSVKVMTAINTHLSRITLNVNILNYPINEYTYLLWRTNIS